MRYTQLYFLFLLLSLSLMVRSEDLSIKQKLLMPGALIEAHAEFEAKCENCHEPFSKKEISSRCLSCHEDIRIDRKNKSGFHGKGSALRNKCETCHTDHEGRDADILSLIPDLFNHSHTNFSLTNAHLNLVCADCHSDTKDFRSAPTKCASCHGEKDPHKQQLGDQCHSCHDTDRWNNVDKFSHSSTKFNLHGKHSQLRCNSCHSTPSFRLETTSCVSCHSIDDVHAGNNGKDCASCHSETDWKINSFDHNQTRFKLDGAHQNQKCASCHTPGTAHSETPMECSSCHKSSDIHMGRFGDDCASCHITRKWKVLNFNHARVSGFPLNGQHSKVNCLSCHTGTVHKNLSRDCQGCHTADDIHHDKNMQLCATCHNPQSWNTVESFNHDFTNFPLLGMHQIAPCKSCHINNQFNLTACACSTCHASEDPHRGSFGDSCQDCHSPNSWKIWVFNHDKTGFVLDGKHGNLACASCHEPGRKVSGAAECVSCHRSEDVHNGKFGGRCGNCHTTESFNELLFK